MAVPGAEGTREGFPRNGFSNVICPVESIGHTCFEESKAVISADGGGKFTGHGTATDGELNLAGRSGTIFLGFFDRENGCSLRRLLLP